MGATININEGAESTLAYLQALLALDAANLHTPDGRPACRESRA